MTRSGAVGLRRVQHAGGDDLQRVVPRRPPQAALAARFLIARADVRVLDHRCPCVHWIGVPRAGVVPRVEQHAAHVWILHADRAVDVPGEDDAARAAPRFVARELRIEARVVKRLHLPRDDAVLDVHQPRAAARAVDAVRAAHDAIVLPAVAIEVLPGARLRIDEITNPAHAGAPRRDTRRADRGRRLRRTEPIRFRPSAPVMANRIPQRITAPALMTIVARTACDV